MKPIAYLLMLLMIMPAPAYGRLKGETKTIVVIPVHNGSADSESDEAAQSLIERFRNSGVLKVIEKRNVDSILRYYERVDTDPRLIDARGILSKAKDGYYRFNYIEAKSLAREAIKRLRNIPDAGFDHGKDLIDAYLTLGIISRSMGDMGEARQAFREALRLDPEYRLDSRAFPPSMVNIFENVRESLRMAPTGSIRVQASPKAADVYLNGVIKGVVPLTLSGLPEGEHYIKISANKYSTVRRRVEVAAGKTVKVSERLEWRGGKVGKLTGKTFATSIESFAQVDEALRIAELMRVDKVVLVDAEEKGGDRVISARMVDAGYKTGHRPIVIPYQSGGLGAAVADLLEQLVSESRVSIAIDPVKYSDPPGSGDPSLMGERKKRGAISKPVLFGILGVVLAAGLGAGLAVGLSGGGGSAAQGGTGSVAVIFK